VYSGSYASALALRAILEDQGITSTFEDLPSAWHGPADSRIYVALRDVPRVMPIVSEFRASASKRESTRGSSAHGP
jgi:hypothetical protein